MAVAVRPARPEDAEGMVRVHGDAWRAAYRGIVPDAFLEGVGREPDAVERRRRWTAHPEALVLVAEDGGEVVGFAIGGPPRTIPPGFDAELALIYVLPGRQGGGIGRRLFGEVAAALAARGSRSLALWVLRDNAPGRAFYERLGGRFLAEKEIEIGGARLVEVAYGWRDLGAIAGGGRPPRSAG
jgi:ribosomal protein S18 acetylase RimI-like enzyme